MTPFRPSVPVEAEEGMLGLEITDLQDTIDLGMEAWPTAGKRQFCFGQRQVLQSLSIAVTADQVLTHPAPKS